MMRIFSSQRRWHWKTFFQSLTVLAVAFYFGALFLSSFRFLSVVPELKELSLSVQKWLNHASLTAGLALFDMEDEKLPYFLNDCIQIRQWHTNDEIIDGSKVPVSAETLFRTEPSCEGRVYFPYIPPTDMMFRRALWDAQLIHELAAKKQNPRFELVADHYLKAVFYYFCRQKVNWREDDRFARVTVLNLLWRHHLGRTDQLQETYDSDLLFASYSCLTNEILFKTWTAL